MKRLRRILFNALTAISLLLAIATAGLWVHGVIHFPSFTYYPNPESGDEFYLFDWHSGAVVIGGHREEYLSPPYYHNPPILPGYRNVDLWGRPRRFFPIGSGFVWRNETTTQANGPDVSRVYSWARGVPLWFPLLLFMILPTTRVVTLIREGRRPPGHCPACGYDMRANPARCSECGHVSTNPSCQ